MAQLQVNFKSSNRWLRMARWRPQRNQASENGAGDRSRTRDILLTREALYQLSYTGEVAGPW
jgi:hypothetical protein